MLSFQAEMWKSQRCKYEKVNSGTVPRYDSDLFLTSASTAKYFMELRSVRIDIGRTGVECKHQVVVLLLHLVHSQATSKLCLPCFDFLWRSLLMTVCSQWKWPPTTIFAILFRNRNHRAKVAATWCPVVEASQAVLWGAYENESKLRSLVYLGNGRQYFTNFSLGALPSQFTIQQHVCQWYATRLSSARPAIIAYRPGERSKIRHAFSLFWYRYPQPLSVS